MYALIENGAVSRYPYSKTDFIHSNPQISWPQGRIAEDVFASYGVLPVHGETPAVGSAQTAEETTPVYNETTQRWERRFVVRDMTAEELAQHKQQLLNSVVMQTQQRLDDFAATRNYDGILSACTYATSVIPKFSVEGQYCVAQRDATWAVLYQIMAEVEASTRTLPSGYAEIEPLLPPLEWPQ